MTLSGFLFFYSKAMHRSVHHLLMDSPN